MQTIIVVVHVLIAFTLIGLILIQHGKGADAGAAFGSGGSGTVFGAAGSGSFLTRTTAILATLFFLTSMFLASFSGNTKKNPQSLMENSNHSTIPDKSDKPSIKVQPSNDKPIINTETTSDQPIIDIIKKTVDVVPETNGSTKALSVVSGAENSRETIKEVKVNTDIPTPVVDTKAQ